jgi:hypothetical protein
MNEVKKTIKNMDRKFSKEIEILGKNGKVGNEKPK